MAVKFEMSEIRAVLPNGITLSLKRVSEKWKFSGEDVAFLLRDFQRQLKNDPDAQSYYNSGNIDEVANMLYKRLASNYRRKI